MLTIQDRQIQVEGPQSDPRTIIDHTPFILSHCSADLRYVYVSPACARLFGLLPEEIAGRKIKDVLGEAAFEAIKPFVKRVLDGETVQYEADIPYKTAGLRSVRVTYTPERNASGNVIGWFASIIDLTEQKRAERQTAADLKAMSLLHDLAGYCAREDAPFEHCLQQIVNVGVELVGAAKGNLQLLQPADGSLVIAAQQGFEKPFLDFFSQVRERAASCAAAMEAMRQIIVNDILTSDIFLGQSSQKILLDENVRAVISNTDFFTHRGDPFWGRFLRPGSLAHSARRGAADCSVGFASCDEQLVAFYGILWPVAYQEASNVGENRTTSEG